MSCLPGMPCYGGYSDPSFTGCGGDDPCNPKIVKSDDIRYTGPNLPCTGINTCEDLTTVLQMIDEKICQLQQLLTTTTTSTTTTTTTLPT